MERVERDIGGAWYIKLRVLQVSKSNSHDVTLVDVSRELTGIYKCEVSAGSPSYHTMIKRAKMEVVGKYVRVSTVEIFFFNFLPQSKINCPVLGIVRNIHAVLRSS